METKNSSKTMSRIRRFGIAAVAAVAGLGMAGAGSAAAASPAADVAPAVVESTVPAGTAYVIGNSGFAHFNGFPLGTVTGGYLLNDGTGVIDLSNGSQIDVSGSMIMPGFGGFVNAKYQGMDYFGELEALFPGGHFYDLQMEDVFGFGDLELTFITITPV